MGTPTIEGSSISMGPLGTTRVACSGAAGLTETAFLAAMNEVESFAIDSPGRLVLEDARGAGLRTGSGNSGLLTRARSRAETAIVAMIRPEAWS